MIVGKGMKISTFLLCITIAFCNLTTIKAEQNLSKSEEQGSHQEHTRSFNPGKFMFDHIGDAHEWHIMDIKDKTISIPLPIILISKATGLHIFMSTRFHHGRETYQNFHIGQDEENEGKIIETLPDGSEVFPMDLSITKNITSLFVSIIILLWIFLSIAKSYKERPNQPPKGLQSWLEPIILFVRDDIARPSIGDKKYEKFMPYLLTVFFFIWINNMLGLVPFFPGGANLTGNIAVTMVLALVTFVITTINGNKVYWQHIFNMPGVPWWLKIPVPLMPFVEFIGVFTKPFVLMVRLFANITAGHIIGLGFLSLIFLFGEMKWYLGAGISVVSVAFIIFMSFLELLVAFIQAYVFTFLSAVYFGMATEEHH
jgi:F-type H+-transporting ATPase subunit a